jgi:hypothetical protein
MASVPSTWKGRELVSKLRRAMVLERAPVLKQGSTGAAGRLLDELIEAEGLSERAEAAGGFLGIDYRPAAGGPEDEAVSLTFHEGSWVARTIIRVPKPEHNAPEEEPTKSDAIKRAQESIERLARIRL